MCSGWNLLIGWDSGRSGTCGWLGDLLLLGKISFGHFNILIIYNILLAVNYILMFLNLGDRTSHYFLLMGLLSCDLRLFLTSNLNSWLKDHCFTLGHVQQALLQRCLSTTGTLWLVRWSILHLSLKRYLCLLNLLLRFTDLRCRIWNTRIIRVSNLWTSQRYLLILDSISCLIGTVRKSGLTIVW